MADKHLTAYIALRDEGIRFNAPNWTEEPQLTVKHKDKLINWARCFRYRGKPATCRADSFYKLLRLEAKKKKWETFYLDKLDRDLQKLKTQSQTCHCSGRFKASYDTLCAKCRKPEKSK